jgi:uncharacterized protein (DUF342 family)
MPPSTPKQKGLYLQISPDRLRAFLVVRPDQNREPITRDDIITLINDNKIPVRAELLKRVDEIMTIFKGGLPREPILLTEGIPAKEPGDAEFVWTEKFQQKTPSADEDETAVSFYDRHKIVTVEAGEIFGEIRPPVPGKDGVDVYGAAVKPSYSPKSIKLGKNVEISPDKRTIKSTSSGQVILQDNKISVNSVLDVKNNVDFETGNIDSATSVCVRGNVCDLFRVQTKQHITVQGMVEASYLQADGDITIVGGVKGRDKALIEAGGDVSAKFVNFVYLDAGGKVTICKEAIDSVILAGDVLDIRFGSIIGGHSFGLKGVKAKSIGSPAGVKTVVGAGLNPLTFKRIFELEQSIKKTKEIIEKVQASVQPFLQQLKRLTPEQREKATELMFKSQEMEMQIEEQKKEIEAHQSSLPPYSEVEIFASSRILPRTQVFIADRYATIQEEIKGPVKVVLRQVEGAKELMLINQLTGSVRSLIAGKLDPETADKVLDLPAKPEIKQPGAKAST